jgi:hypothetical protein
MLRLRDRLRELLDDLPPASARRVAVVLVAESRQAAEARAAMSRVLLHGAVAAEVAGTVVVDARGVAALYAGGSGPGLGRSVFLRSVRGLVPRLTETGPAFATGSGLPAPRRRSVWSR